MYRFSDRLAALSLPESRFSALLSKLRADGQRLLDLTSSNPTEALADYPHHEISEALAGIQNFRYQPEPFGHLPARAAIVEYLEKRNTGMRLSPSQVALTASTSEAYALLFKLLANPGDEVLAPTPSYPLFEYLAHLEGVKLRSYRLAYDGSWFIDFGSLEAAVSDKTRAVILVNPNNPTGSFLRPDEYQRLCQFALAHRLPLISDEVFMDYASAGSGQRVSTLNGRNDVLSFTLNGLSKAAGMPQMKLAWIVVNGPAGEREKVCTRLELILDTYLSVSAPVQLATQPLLAVGDGIQEQIRQRLQQNLSMLDELLVASPLQRLHSEGGWSAVLRVPQILSEEEWITRLLLDQQVVVQPGYFFDLQGGAFLVVSLLIPLNQFAEGVSRMLALTKELLR